MGFRCKLIYVLIAETVHYNYFSKKILTSRSWSLATLFISITIWLDLQQILVIFFFYSIIFWNNKNYLSAIINNKNWVIKFDCEIIQCLTMKLKNYLQFFNGSGVSKKFQIAALRNFFSFISSIETIKNVFIIEINNTPCSSSTKT